MAQLKRDSEYLEYVTAKSPWLRRIAFLLCQDWHRADDLVQSTITKLYINWPKVAKVDHPDSYARAILVNHFLAEQRSPWWRRVTMTSEPIEVAAPDAGRQIADLDLRLHLGGALAAIPPRQRTALVLRYYCDLSLEQTAQIMGCSVGTVKSQSARGLTAVRAVLSAESAA